ncbi:MAG TPA: metalloregulator ArsR/SmtB family transcription factor [Halanaerobiales bacterium]|nr:metalloregulator ArsR/SmtB family transcription factor [Halanaerobiales bacterium]
MELLEIMKALSHENRLRILNLIKDEQLCVCEIEYVLDINQSNASRHLNKLKQANLIVGERKAQWIYYKINQEVIKEHKFLDLIIKQELKKITICQEDEIKLKEYQQSGLSCQDLD